jgi:RNA polymerase sigma-70 factor (ECF subfamily)
MTSDSDLVRQAQQGERTAYAELVRRWSARVLAVCQSRVRSAHTAEELAQDALLRSMRALPTLRDPDRFGSWLCSIASQACLDWLKSSQAKQVSIDAMADGRGDSWVVDRAVPPDAEAVRAEDEQRLMDEVALLPESYREVILIYYYDNVTYQDVANMLGVSTATVNARLTKARAMLRERLSSLCRGE